MHVSSASTVNTPLSTDIFSQEEKEKQIDKQMSLAYLPSMNLFEI